MYEDGRVRETLCFLLVNAGKVESRRVRVISTGYPAIRTGRQGPRAGQKCFIWTVLSRQLRPFSRRLSFSCSVVVGGGVEGVGVVAGALDTTSKLT